MLVESGFKRVFFHKKGSYFQPKTKKIPLCAAQNSRQTHLETVAGDNSGTLEPAVFPQELKERLNIGVTLEQLDRNTAKDPDGAGCINKQPLC